MADPDDPVKSGTNGSRDLYGVATWENRSLLDSAASIIYRGAMVFLRILVLAVAVAILISQGALVVRAARDDPILGFFVLLSAVPALLLGAYLWYLDPTSKEKLGMLVGTFLLGVLFAGFAAIVNSVFQPLAEFVPIIGMALFFYLIVAPIEETVKLLAVRIGPYNSDQFNTVIDGAVYGAMAGLGFATIENTLYIFRQYFSAVEAGTGFLGQTFGTTVVRSLAGPGHVIYSAFAGYYLGLAKFNPEDAGPIVVKGILIAAFIHGTYNTIVTYLPLVYEFSFLSLVAFVLIYDGIFGYLLYRKLDAYRTAYDAVDASA